MIILTSHQRGVLIAKRNLQERNKKFPIGTSDQQIEVLGGRLGIVEFLVGSEVRKERG